MIDNLRRAGRELRPLGSVRGFNYSKGIWLTLTLFKPLPPSPDGGGQNMDRAQGPLPSTGPAG